MNDILCTYRYNVLLVAHSDRTQVLEALRRLTLPTLQRTRKLMHAIARKSRHYRVFQTIRSSYTQSAYRLTCKGTCTPSSLFT